MDNWSVRCIQTLFLTPLIGCQGDNTPASHPAESVASRTVEPSEAPSDPNVRWLDFGTLSPDPIAVHPQGRQVAVRTRCETIVYDLPSGQRRYSWPDASTVSGYSGDGNFLLTSKKGRVALWDTEKFVEQQAFQGNPPAWNEIDVRGAPLAVLDNHAALVAMSNSHGAFDRDLPCALLLFTRTGTFQHTLTVPDDARIQQAAFTHGDRLLMRYANIEDNTYNHQSRLHDTKSGGLVREFPRGHRVRASLDGRFVASARLFPDNLMAYDPSPVPMELSVWKGETGELLHVIRHSIPLRDFVFSPDGYRILAPAGDRVIEWDAESGEVRFESELSDKPYASVAYSPSGQRRFATTEEPNGLDEDVDHHLRGWDVATGTLLSIDDFAFDSYNGEEQLFFFPDSKRFIDLAANSSVRDVLTGETLQTVPEYRAPTREVAFMPDGKKFLVDGTLNDMTSGRQRRWSLPGAKHRFVQDGRTLFSGNHTGVFLTDVASGATYWRLRLKSSYVPWDVAVAPDAKRVVVAYRFGELPSQSRLMILEPSQPDDPLILHRYATAVAVHPDGGRFLASNHECIGELDLATGDEIRTLWKPPGRVLFVAYSPDGSKVLAGGVSGHVDIREPVDIEDEGWAMIHDTVTHQTVSLMGHTGPVTTGTFRADGRRCVTGSLDETIRLWNSDSREEVHVFRGHIGAIHDLAYSPTGDRILSAAEDGSAIWNLAGIVDPSKDPDPVAGTFTTVESINAYNGAAQQPRGKLFTGKEDGPPPSPATGQAEWTVIQVGDVRGDPTLSQNWLSEAKTTRRVGSNRSSDVLELLPGYDAHGSSRDGSRRVYSSDQKDQIVVVDENGDIKTTWKGRLRNQEVAISPSGKEVAIAREVQAAKKPFENAIHQVTVYDADSGEPKRTMEDVGAWYVHSLKIGPNEKTILLQVNNYSLEVRDYQTGEKLAELKGHPGGAGLRSDYSLDGRFIVTCKYPDPVVHFRDPLTLGTVKALENHLPVRWFRLTPDGRHILAGQPYAEKRNLVTMWNIDPGERVWSRAGPASKTGIYSPDGCFYLTKAGWYHWTLWDLEKGSVECVVITDGDVWYNRPQFAADGHSIYLGSPEGPLLWPASDAPGARK